MSLPELTPAVKGSMLLSIYPTPSSFRLRGPLAIFNNAHSETRGLVTMF